MKTEVLPRGAAHALAVKEVVSIAAALALACVTGLLALELFPESPRQGALAAAALSPDTELIFVGTSHVYVDVDPVQTGQTWMNLAGMMLDYQLSEGVLKTYSGRLSRLRAVLLEFDSLMVTVDSTALYVGDSHALLDLEPDLSTLGVPWSTWLALRKDQLFSYELPFRRAFSRDKFDVSDLSDILLPPQTEIIVSPGHESRPGTDAEGLSGELRVRRHVEYSKSADANGNQRNLAAFARMLEHCKERGLPVVLVRLPHHASYVAARPHAFEEATASLMHIAEPGLREGTAHLLDLEQLPFRDAEFHDGDHLNASGAARFSRTLAEQVRAYLASSPTRSAFDDASKRIETSRH